jgi:ectoine hydroxylase-related dioxygenase (phytanoyl-CoA dioxygenase family)
MSSTTLQSAADVYMPDLPDQKLNKLVEVKPSGEEIARGRLNDAHIKLFLSGMHRDGVVILRDIIDPAHLEKINEFMIQDTEDEMRKDDTHRNFGVENLQQGPPVAPSEYFFDDVYLNPILFHAVTLYLGPDAKWDLTTGNNAVPHGTRRQPVHSDAMCKHPPAPFYVVANVYTVDTSPSNGSTEIWLGTHHFNSEAQTPPGPRGETHILPKYVEDREKTLRGFQPTVKRGSVLFRDMRLWHAGMPNKSDATRFMIALGFSSSWWHGTMRFRIPAKTGVYERIMHGTKHHGIIPQMEEVSVEEYATLRNAYDFDNAEMMTYEGEIF